MEDSDLVPMRMSATDLLIYVILSGHRSARVQRSGSLFQILYQNERPLRVAKLFSKRPPSKVYDLTAEDVLDIFDTVFYPTSRRLRDVFSWWERNDLSKKFGDEGGFLRWKQTVRERLETFLRRSSSESRDDDDFFDLCMLGRGPSD